MLSDVLNRYRPSRSCSLNLLLAAILACFWNERHVQFIVTGVEVLGVLDTTILKIASIQLYVHDSFCKWQVIESLEGKGISAIACGW